MKRPRSKKQAPDFETLFRSAPDSYLVLSPDFTILDASDAYLAATMTDLKRIQGRNIFEVFPDRPDDPHATGVKNLRASLERVLEKREPDTMAVQKYDIRKPLAEGGHFVERHWVPVNIPVLGKDGALRYIIHRVEDVTEFINLKKQEAEGGEFIGALNVITARKAIEKELQKAHRFLQDMLNHIPDPIFMKDKEHRWIGGNEAFWQLMNGPPEKFIGKSDYEFFPKEEADVFWEKDDKVLNSEVADVNEEFFTDSEGRRHVFSTKKIAFLNEKGEKYLVGVIRDITDIRNAEAEREKLIAELTESNTELERFAYICSHDLQEPLRMISSFTQGLAKHLGNNLDAKAKHYMGYIEGSSYRARDLINDVLAYARIGHDAGPLVFVDAQEVLAGVLDDLAEHRKEVGAVITHDAMPRLQVRRTHISQLFQNLISNALKFSLPGSTPKVHVGAERSGEFWKFSVADNGIGIAPVYMHKLFTIFQRLHSREEYPGTGIGLAVCKKIIQQYGGEIWAESAKGKGSTFYFTLPAIGGK